MGNKIDKTELEKVLDKGARNYARRLYEDMTFDEEIERDIYFSIMADELNRLVKEHKNGKSA